ncbi:pancreatic triacylglycerol lipase-like protein [Dinothrombium tinctorium]|uniref:Pancreatic triacylglycerol lipase-like protein n=1 Tax=Dinothrombium tinctorium TaxID=1965070 RepID=A0A3S5WGQ9_9ACAR|nr:pancreatic triacylglycerol lipase-like protein [Dinothrombium tinctorium]RWS06990.1 pancreatic triacylglycerol lipase-like protein [Dinothrombium tinctorium]RWS07020.1 pancreatic triacylglycerol lipase-like protein [Dinothrombium tinctorium]
MRDQFLINDDLNIIFVDWKGGNNLPYTQAASNTRVVGAETALFIQFLMNQTGVTPDSIHLIGHSLGAHVAGYAGERVPKLGRITALDPAELYFQYLPETVRIDPSDAQFVDVIHSDTRSILVLGLGMRQPCGHIDFYPNGGETHPGCSLSRVKAFFVSGISEGLRRLVGCNHQRAIDFFTSSINTKNCEMVSYTCPNYDFFEKGRCTYCGENGNLCPIMGLKADLFKNVTKRNKSLSVYLRTREEKPYCCE